MSETLWISLPEQEVTSLREVIHLIGTNNLTALTVNQLIEKLEDEQAAGWIAVLEQYNRIASVGNLDSPHMLHRTRSVKRKFSERGYQPLENQVFQPNELIALVILCYSNPNLMGPRLCAALNANNREDIKKEILENSAYVSSQARIMPWASNLRLLTYALYANDTTVQLPAEVITRIREEAEARHIILDEIGQSRNTRSIDSIEGSDSLALPLMVNELPADVLDVLKEDNTINFTEQSINGAVTELASSIVTSGFIAESTPAFNNAAVSSHRNTSAMLLSGLVGFYFLRNIPVISPVVRNINREIHAGVARVAGFFSGSNTGNDTKDTAQQPNEYLPSHSKVG